MNGSAVERQAAYLIAGLELSYGAGVVLSIPELAVPRGAVTVVTGANGSGKTTLLRLLNGLLDATAGTVTYGGEPISRRSPGALRRETVFVHHAPPVMSGSVLRNVSYGLRLRRLPPREVRGRALGALDAMGLTGMETRPASSLSSGQRKRLGIARALALDPMVLLLDEPDANVDTESVRIIEGAIRRGRARGMTAIVSTHDAGFAYRQADHLLRLDEGRLAPSAANVLRGRVSARDEDFCHFDAAGVPILCPTREGDFEVAVIPLGDVILSRELVWTSARNRLRGTVAEIHAQGPLYRVSVDCGIRIEALVTGAALRELAIEPGRSVHVSFKASAVALY